MNLGTYLTGPFGQSPELYKARNEAKRGRGSENLVAKQVREDTQQIIQLQKEAGLDFIIDPMFKFFYLFQPLAENFPRVTVGRQENWFNNNVFYRRPQIQGPSVPIVDTGFTEEYLHWDELPKNGRAMAILPSPYSLLMLSEVNGYSNKKEAVSNLAEIMQAEAGHLVSKGIGRIQYDEPAIVVKQSLGSLREEDLQLLQRGMEICGKVKGATTSLQTYFGDAGPIIPFLLTLPVDCLGIDGTETNLTEISKYKYSGKEVALGLLDARNTSLENPGEIAEQVQFIAQRTNPKKIWLTPNTATEYRGFTHGIKKLNLLKLVKEMLYLR